MTNEQLYCKLKADKKKYTTTKVMNRNFTDEKVLVITINKLK